MVRSSLFFEVYQTSHQRFLRFLSFLPPFHLWLTLNRNNTQNPIFEGRSATSAHQNKLEGKPKIVLRCAESYRPSFQKVRDFELFSVFGYPKRGKEV
jgi:hypothetical protein